MSYETSSPPSLGADWIGNLAPSEQQLEVNIAGRTQAANALALLRAREQLNQNLVTGASNPIAPTALAPAPQQAGVLANLPKWVPIVIAALVVIGIILYLRKRKRSKRRSRK